MSEIRRVTEMLSVAHQITVEDVARAAAQGFTLLINNRPDGEEPGQATGAAIEAAAVAAGLGYIFIPVRGGPTREQAQAQFEAVEAAGGPVLAFCRTGTRSINTWALGAALGGLAPEDLVRLGAGAGYDLRALLS